MLLFAFFSFVNFSHANYFLPRYKIFVEMKCICVVEYMLGLFLYCTYLERWSLKAVALTEPWSTQSLLLQCSSKHIQLGTRDFILRQISWHAAFVFQATSTTQCNYLIKSESHYCIYEHSMHNSPDDAHTVHVLKVSSVLSLFFTCLLINKLLYRILENKDMR